MASPPPFSSFVLEGMLDEGQLKPDKLLYALNQFSTPTTQALSHGLTFKENFKATVKDVRFTMPSTPPVRAVGGTGQPAFANSWVNFNTSTDSAAGFWIEPGGRVYLVGNVKTGTPGSTSAIFTLPSGYRPSLRMNYAVDSNGAFGRARIETDGDVIAAAGSTTHFSIDGIQFIATSPASPTAFTGTYGGSPWPLLVQHGLPRCTGLVPLSCTLKDGGLTESVGAPYVCWEDKGDGQARIKSVWGLTWAKTYTMKVLMLAE